MPSIFQFVNMVYHIDRFAHLAMIYDIFNMLLDSVCWDFVEDF